MNTNEQKLVRKSGEQRFTLVEMLVVIAIIGILASLLVPSLQNALAASRAVTCQNNLKQMVAAGQIYANQFNGDFVPAQTTQKTWSVAWFGETTYRSYMQFPTSSASDPTMWPLGSLCPMAEYAAVSNTSNVMYSYGMNYSELQPLFTSGALCKAYRLSRIISPSKRFVFIDSFDWIVGFATNNTPTSSSGYWNFLEEKTSARPACQTAYRHKDVSSANIAYFDGHVEMQEWTVLSNLSYLSLWKAYH